MSARFEWDPKASERIQREVVKNLTPKFQQAMATVTCPDHTQHPRVESQGMDWRIEGCCEKAVKLGEEAVAKVLR